MNYIFICHHLAFRSAHYGIVVWQSIFLFWIRVKMFYSFIPSFSLCMSFENVYNFLLNCSLHLITIHIFCSEPRTKQRTTKKWWNVLRFSCVSKMCEVVTQYFIAVAIKKGERRHMKSRYLNSQKEKQIHDDMPRINVGQNI